MSGQDRIRWDRRYAGQAEPDRVALPSVFGPSAAVFPTGGRAIELACGRGAAAVWLALRGMHVTAYDVSPVAIAAARDLAQRSEVDARCRFEVVDLDDGIPPGPEVDVLLCNKFRDPRLDAACAARTAAGGLLAVSALSEVGASPGPFRARRGELVAAFAAFEVIDAGEAEGLSWLLARRR